MCFVVMVSQQHCLHYRIYLYLWKLLRRTIIQPRSYLLLDLNCNNVSQNLYEARYDVNLKTFQLGCLVYILQVLVFSIGLTTMI